jgi:hypothetical protein
MKQAVLGMLATQTSTVLFTFNTVGTFAVFGNISGFKFRDVHHAGCDARDAYYAAHRMYRTARNVVFAGGVR